MELRIESETGEYICDVELSEDDVERLIDFAKERLQEQGNSIKYNNPLKDEEITQLLEYSIITILQEEITKFKEK